MILSWYISLIYRPIPLIFSCQPCFWGRYAGTDSIYNGCGIHENNTNQRATELASHVGQLICWASQPSWLWSKPCLHVLQNGPLYILWSIYRGPWLESVDGWLVVHRCRWSMFAWHLTCTPVTSTNGLTHFASLSLNTCAQIRQADNNNVLWNQSTDCCIHKPWTSSRRCSY